jgi:superfamily II DNA or RNA helicase
MGCALIAARRRPALILVHTTDLLAQWVENLRALLGVEPGILGGGRRTFAPVTVGMIQTLGRDPGTLAEAAGRFGLVLLDECHHAPAASFAAVANALPAAFRYGLTATPERADGLAPLMAAVVGPMRATVPPADLEEAGVRVRPVLRGSGASPALPSTPRSGSIWWVPGRVGHSDGIILREARALLAEGRTVLILAPRVAQAETLAEALAEGGPSDVGILHGRMRRAERAATLEAVRSGAVRGLVATTVADEGLDLPSLDGLLLASPGRAGGRTEQRIGRIMRSLRGKRVPVVVDLVDDHPVLRSQARGRFFETYRSLCAGAELPEWLRSRGRAA